MGKGRATSVKPVEPARRRKESVPRTAAWHARAAAGKQARLAAPLEDQAVFEPTELRADPVELLGRQGPARVQELLPIRYGRMVSSPFAFYRGAALVMAADLATTPSSGLRVQLCGDAHLSNFGFYASPERHLVFDLNDFDETLPGPFEWDVKRLAASVEIAARSQSFRTRETRAIVVDAVRSYRESMRTFAEMPNQAVWYARLDADEFMAKLRAAAPPERTRRAEMLLASARTKDSLQAFRKLTHVVDGQPRIISDPPLIVPVEELFPDQRGETIQAQMEDLLAAYRATLVSDRKHLFDQYRFVHMARKVVGVGSVGTRAWILLFEGLDGGDPLFLQAKEAQSSVLEQYAGVSEYANHGERVVAGQRLMRASSDIFLGWQRTNGLDGVDRDYYLRQLRDWKASAEVEGSVPEGMAVYARVCGWTLARAHARSGDRVAIGAYLGKHDRFDEAIADFASAYADQNDKDHAALRAAIDDGRIEATEGV
ncbi:MAG: DUF2252 domain-containing protein [Actinobacteria bacterium]|nr:DUF2252 domain-containing protein [Actinomycetota bacterium]